MTDIEETKLNTADIRPTYVAPELIVISAYTTEGGIASNPVEGPITTPTGS